MACYEGHYNNLKPTLSFTVLCSHWNTAMYSKTSLRLCDRGRRGLGSYLSLCRMVDWLDFSFMWNCQWIQLLIVRKKERERCARMFLLRGKADRDLVLHMEGGGGGINAGLLGGIRMHCFQERKRQKVKVREWKVMNLITWDLFFSSCAEKVKSRVAGAQFWALKVSGLSNRTAHHIFLRSPKWCKRPVVTWHMALPLVHSRHWVRLR